MPHLPPRLTRSQYTPSGFTSLPNPNPTTSTQPQSTIAPPQQQQQQQVVRYLGMVQDVLNPEYYAKFYTLAEDGHCVKYEVGYKDELPAGGKVWESGGGEGNEWGSGGGGGEELGERGRYVVVSIPFTERFVDAASALEEGGVEVEDFETSRFFNNENEYQASNARERTSEHDDNVPSKRIKFKDDTIPSTKKANADIFHKPGKFNTNKMHLPILAKMYDSNCNDDDSANANSEMITSFTELHTRGKGRRVKKEWRDIKLHDVIELIGVIPSLPAPVSTHAHANDDVDHTDHSHSHQHDHDHYPNSTYKLYTDTSTFDAFEAFGDDVNQANATLPNEYVLPRVHVLSWFVLDGGCDDLVRCEDGGVVDVVRASTPKPKVTNLTTSIRERTINHLSDRIFNGDDKAGELLLLTLLSKSDRTLPPKKQRQHDSDSGGKMCKTYNNVCLGCMSLMFNVAVSDVAGVCARLRDVIGRVFVSVCFIDLDYNADINENSSSSNSDDDDSKGHYKDLSIMKNEQTHNNRIKPSPLQLPRGSVLIIKQTLSSKSKAKASENENEKCLRGYLTYNIGGIDFGGFIGEIEGDFVQIWVNSTSAVGSSDSSGVEIEVDGDVTSNLVKYTLNRQSNPSQQPAAASTENGSLIKEIRTYMQTIRKPHSFKLTEKICTMAENTFISQRALSSSQITDKNANDNAKSMEVEGRIDEDTEMDYTSTLRNGVSLRKGMVGEVDLGRWLCLCKVVARSYCYKDSEKNRDGKDSRYEEGIVCVRDWERGLVVNEWLD